jgi:hypothetical protein
MHQTKRMALTLAALALPSSLTRCAILPATRQGADVCARSILKAQAFMTLKTALGDTSAVRVAAANAEYAAKLAEYHSCNTHLQRDST